SDKAAYRSPTRGAQGNALKTVFGIPRALGADKPVIIEACRVRQDITAYIDPAGEVRVQAPSRNSARTDGTRVQVALPLDACRYFRPTRWAAAFALFNPHATVRILKTRGGRVHAHTGQGRKGNLYHSAVEFPGGGWRKFLPTDLTSSWWYDDAA